VASDGREDGDGRRRRRMCFRLWTYVKMPWIASNPCMRVIKCRRSRSFSALLILAAAVAAAAMSDPCRISKTRVFFFSLHIYTVFVFGSDSYLEFHSC
jgi:hypothetical protein